MPVLASWLDYIPDGGQARDVVDDASAKARAVAADLGAASARTCAEALLAAAELVRAEVLTKKDAGSWHLRAPFERALGDLEVDPSRRAIAGVLAFANILLARRVDPRSLRFDDARRPRPRRTLARAREDVPARVRARRRRRGSRARVRGARARAA